MTIPASDQPLPAPPRPAPRAEAPRDEEIDVFGLTHRGRVRKQNQDHFLLCSLHKSMRVVGTSLPTPETLQTTSQRLAFIGVVADGVGGTDGGEEASRAAIEAVATYVTNTLQCYYRSDPSEEEQFLHMLEGVAHESHERVLARGRERPDLAGLATTLTMGIAVWPAMYVLHLGDSRAYRLRDGQLERLTKDQTLAQDLVDTGVLTETSAHRSPFAHVLSSAIGGTARPAVARFETVPGDVMLLCTDGLTKHVPDERIRERLVTIPSAEAVCRALIEDALADGGTDNVTVVVGREKAKPS